MRKTTNYNLSQYDATDRVTRAAFNADNAAVDAALKAIATAAANAGSAASAAQTTANSASSAAATAQSTANTAKTSAATAQSTANTAKSNAATAQSTANTAKSNAATAQSTAATAQSTANSALAAAQAAGNCFIEWGTYIGDGEWGRTLTVPGTPVFAIVSGQRGNYTSDKSFLFALRGGSGSFGFYYPAGTANLYHEATNATWEDNSLTFNAYLNSNNVFNTNGRQYGYAVLYAK